MYYGWEARITEAEMVEFLQICLSKAGADSMITPREMLRDYMTVLNILMQNENATFESVVGKITLKPADEIGGEETASNDTDSAEVPTSKKLTKDELDVLEF